LLKLKVPEIFLHDVGHCHAQRRREVLLCHRPLFFGILKELGQAVRKASCISGRIKLNRQVLALCHLPEVAQVCADDGHAVGTSQVCDSAAPC